MSLYPTTITPTSEHTLSPWLQEVAQRRIDIAFPLQDARIQEIMQRAFDWIIHLFLYHLNFNQNYCTFYDNSLRARISASAHTPSQPPHPVDLDSNTQPINQPLLTPPIGFGYYGNSCWVASAVQIFLAIPWFEETVWMPLEQKEGETDQTFQDRKEVQNALIAIIDLKKQSDCNSNKMSVALKEFHKRIRSFDNGLPHIGEMGSAESLILAVVRALNLDLGRAYDCNIMYENYQYFGFFKPTPGRLFLVKESGSIILFNESSYRDFVNQSGHPQLIKNSTFIPGIPDDNVGYTFQSNDGDKIINIPFEDGTTSQYRVVGFIKNIILASGIKHAISYVSVGGIWYCCNDSRISPLESIAGISVTYEDPIILERIDL